MKKKILVILLVISILLNFIFLIGWSYQINVSDQYCQIAHKLREFSNMAIDDLNELDAFPNQTGTSFEPLEKIDKLGDCPITKYSEVEK